MSTTIPLSESPPWSLSKHILDQDGLSGALHLLAPGAEQLCPGPAPGGRLVFVVAGSVTVQSGRTHYILQPEETVLLAAGSVCTVRNHETGLAKVLVVDLAPPRVMRDPALTTLLRG
ncbi:MAG: hypothetical protein MUE42_00950 [Opitutaceae bacterium]|jgi:redox-sensitive bicupin YhaK (pirin superfamily)|nr:hypothetical protein [Opitutaceae bacterium]